MDKTHRATLSGPPQVAKCVRGLDPVQSVCTCLYSRSPPEQRRPKDQLGPGGPGATSMGLQDLGEAKPHVSRIPQQGPEVGSDLHREQVLERNERAPLSCQPIAAERFTRPRNCPSPLEKPLDFPAKAPPGRWYS